MTHTLDANDIYSAIRIIELSLNLHKVQDSLDGDLAAALRLLHGVYERISAVPSASHSAR